MHIAYVHKPIQPYTIQKVRRVQKDEQTRKQDNKSNILFIQY